MEQIGWFVVGDGKYAGYYFGVDNDSKNDSDKLIHSPIFVEDEEELQYWKIRGYDIIPAYVNGVDKEDYSFVGEEE